MAQLDGEMKTVLDRNDTSQDEKAKLYSQILELPSFQREAKCGKHRTNPCAIVGRNKKGNKSH
jgi:hypothetical protein